MERSIYCIIILLGPLTRQNVSAATFKFISPRSRTEENCSHTARGHACVEAFWLDDDTRGCIMYTPNAFNTNNSITLRAYLPLPRAAPLGELGASKHPFLCAFWRSPAALRLFFLLHTKHPYHLNKLKDNMCSSLHAWDLENGVLALLQHGPALGLHIVCVR